MSRQHLLESRQALSLALESKCDFVVVISCPMSATFEVLTLCSLSRPLSFQLNGAQLSLRFRTENRAFKAIFAGKSGQL